MASKNKIVAIVGPTSSGKSELGNAIATKFGGEIICADSRTIYRGMDIGTAKPTANDQANVVHHGLDIIEPSQSFSAAEFKRLANRHIKEIQRKGRLPILVGGSGLYVYSVIFDYKFPAGPTNELRESLNKLTIDELKLKLKMMDSIVFQKIDINNPRRLIRAIETAGQDRTAQDKLRENTILVGVFPGFDELKHRIKNRTKMMIDSGLVDEVRSLDRKYGETEALKSIGYNEIRECIDGKYSLAEATELINLHTLQLAKRQMTWLKRNKEINWFTDVGEGLEYISEQLS